MKIKSITIETENGIVMSAHPEAVRFIEASETTIPIGNGWRAINVNLSASFRYFAGLKEERDPR